MDLLPLTDERWKTYRSGYNRASTDAGAWVSTLINNRFSDQHWDYLWDDLYHQGDVGEASYAVVPYLATYAKQHNATDWQLWGFPVVVELARLEGNNPDIPTELKSSYFQAIEQLANVASSQTSWSDSAAPLMSACIMLAKGQPVFARAYMEMADRDTALEFIKEQTG